MPDPNWGQVIYITPVFNMYLLTEWKDWMGKYLAQGQDVQTEYREVRAF